MWENPFEINILEEPFSPMVPAYVESAIGAKVIDFVHYMKHNYPYPINTDAMWKELNRFEIDYFSLPQYLKDKIDTIDVQEI